MTEETQSAPDADYAHWVDQEWDSDEYDPADPMSTKQAFIAGWRAGAEHLRGLLTLLPAEDKYVGRLIEDLKAGRYSEAPPSQ